MATMSSPNLDFCSVFSESRRIMKSHSRHFLALSVLFLLPLSFSLSVYPTLHHSLLGSSTNQPQSLLRSLHHHHQDLKPLLFHLLYSMFILSFSLYATVTITYSIYQGFFGRPVKLVSALKSLVYSLHRLVFTFVCSLLIVSAVSVVYGILTFLVVRGIQFLGFHQFSTTDFYVFVHVISPIVLGLGLVYLYVNWALAAVVVVVEASWGLEPLRRSAYLVKGMRGLVLALLLFFGLCTYGALWASWESEVGSGVWGALRFVLKTVLGSACGMMFLLQSVAANTVVYMYCKAFHGELAGEIAEEFARDYVSLPFDEEKAPFVVSVVQP